VNNTTIRKNTSAYHGLWPPKKLPISRAVCATHGVSEFWKKPAMIAGKVRIDWAKMIGIMPAILICSGSEPRTGML